MKKIFGFLGVALWAIFKTTYDVKNLFSNDQAITATANSTNVVDQGDGFYNQSKRVIDVFVTEDFAALTSLTIGLYSAAAASMASQVLVFQTAAIAAADLVVGKHIQIPIPQQADRYLRLTYTVAGTDATAGKVFAGIGLESGSQTAFQDGNL